VRCKHLIVEKFFSLSPQAVERLQLKEVHDVSCMHFFFFSTVLCFRVIVRAGVLLDYFFFRGCGVVRYCEAWRVSDHCYRQLGVGPFWRVAPGGGALGKLMGCNMFGEDGLLGS